MSKVDIIVCHPYEIRYPVWEKMIRANMDYYNKLFVVFTKGNFTGKDYSGEVGLALLSPQVVFLDMPAVGEGFPNSDWRHTAVRYALAQSEADYILFLEQDLLIPSLKVVQDFKGDVLGIKEGDRIHPAFLLVKRELINKTDRDFAAYPDKEMDHFDKFIAQLPIPEILPKSEYYHMAGFTHNEALVAQGKEPNYRPDEYKLFKMMERII